MAIFPTSYFLSNLKKENVFYDILERKNAFLGYKNKNFKKSKNTHFSKRVNPSFWSKNGHFCKFFFLGHIGQKNVFCDILELKNAFLDYKKTSSKSRKNWHLSKRVYPIVLVKKWSFFQIFFLGNIGKETLFYDFLQLKNVFLGYKNKKFKKPKNWHFSKTFNPWFWRKNGHFSNFFF